MRQHGLRFPRFSLALAFTLAFLDAGLRPAIGRADGLADEAELHFQIGTELYQRTDYRGALEHFFLSNRLVPNRNVVYNIARTFEQLRRFADAHRYYVDSLEGEANEQAITEIRAALGRITPNVALLNVTTSPPGATIYIDRRDLGSRGRAPRLLALPPGRYRVIAELAGYDAGSAEVVEAQLGKEIPVALTLKQIVGTVQISIKDVDHAVVRVDDEHSAPACTAPCALDLAPGMHQLFFSWEGYEATPLQVMVTARQTSRVTALLRPLTGSLVVDATERGALVTIDDRIAGFTPVVIPNVPTGRRKVRVSLRGYTAVEREIVIRPNQQTALSDLSLDPRREVTAVSRYAESIEDAPSSVSVIEGQEIRAFGYPTIAEALRGIRGVYLSNDRVYASAGVRGVGQPNDYGNRVLVLSDGHPLNDDLLNSSYIGSDGRADLGDVDRIEVVRGPGSLLYGAGAFSGVVDLVTRPRDEPSSVHVGIGTYDNAVARARVGGHYNFSSTAGVWASVSAARSDGITVPMPVEDPASGTVTTRTAHQVDSFTAGGTAGRAWWGPVTLQWFFHRRAQRTPIGAYATVFDDPRNQSVDTQMMTELRVEPQIVPSVRLLTRAHANRYTFGGTYVFADSENLEDFAGTWFGGEARVEYTPIPTIRIAVGGEGQYHPQAALHGVKVRPSFSDATYLNENRPYGFAAGYALADAALKPWLRLSGGIRVDVYSTFIPIFVPRAAVILKPAAGSVLKVMGGRAFRAPSIYEQLYNDGGESQVRSDAPCPMVSGPTPRCQPLGPESIYSGEIEFSQRFLQSWVVLGAAHASLIEQIIDSVPEGGNPEVIRYQNSLDPTVTIGGDVEIRREWRGGWMLSGTYGYQLARYLQGGRLGAQLVNAPEHLASLRGVVPVVADFASLGLRLSLEAPRKIDPTTDRVTSTGMVADATLSGHVRRFGLRYTIGVYNFTDWKYELPVTLNFAGRTIPQGGRTFLLDVLATYP